MRSDRSVPALMLAGSLGLLAGAWAFELIGGLVPCEMCWWQRWALMAVAGLSGLALLLPVRALTVLPLVAMLGNAGIAAYHAGVERKWWQGLTRCTAPPTAGDAKSMMADILAQPLVRCDAIPWQLFGVSMAGWNGIVSLILVGGAAWLMLKSQ